MLRSRISVRGEIAHALELELGSGLGIAGNERLYFDSLHHYERFRIQHLAEITLCFGSRILNVEKTVAPAIPLRVSGS